MILLNAICKLFEVIAVGSVVTFVILFVSVEFLQSEQT